MKLDAIGEGLPHVGGELGESFSLRAPMLEPRITKAPQRMRIDPQVAAKLLDVLWIVDGGHGRLAGG